MTKRKHDANSAKAQIEAAIAVSLPELEPPQFMPLREAARDFWPGIMASRARDEWLPVDLVVAAQLAECQACIRDESSALQAEGTVMENARGTMVANPRTNILEALARREMALMRTLRMGGRIAGDIRDEAGRRRNEHRARMAQNQVHAEDEDFIA